MTVMVTYPHANTVSHNFSWSLMNLVLADRDIIHTVLPMRGYPGDGLIIARNKAVEHFLGTDAEWLFTLDTDIGFPAYVLGNLLSHKDDYKVMSGLYSTVMESVLDNGMGSPMSWNKMPLALRRSGQGFRQYPDYQGFMEVDAVGAGCLLMHREVLEKIGSGWFSCRDGLGEDFSFCVRVQEAGYKILCDTTFPLTHHKSVWV